MANRREAVTDFLLLGSKITADGDCSTTASWQESYDKPRQRVKKQRDYFADKGLNSQGVFPVVTYGCESWTLKKSECQKIDAFNL